MMIYWIHENNLQIKIVKSFQNYILKNKNKAVIRLLEYLFV